MPMTRNTLKLMQQTPDWGRWRWQLAHSIRDPRDLAGLFGLDGADADRLRQVAARYPVLVTPYYLALAATWDLADPILRQCVPASAELAPAASGAADPLAEERDSPVPGVVHRYPDRVLYIATNACAVHCRHCMRKRNWRGGMRRFSRRAAGRAVAYVRARPQIREVILSGGDPLLIAPESLDWLLAEFRKLAHVQVIRIGSRLPAVLPQRLTPEFCALLGRHAPVWLATHFNHPRELTAAAAVACENLVRSGVPVLNQTVLLRGVNDDPEVMRDLCTGLLRLRVKPYALYHGDPVTGTMHFRTGLARGREILAALDGRVSGPAIPVLAFDLPGGHGKVRLTPDRERGRSAAGEAQFESCSGEVVSYPEPPGTG